MLGHLLAFALAGALTGLGMLWLSVLTRWCPPDPPEPPPEPADPRWHGLALSLDREDAAYAELRGRAG